MKKKINWWVLWPMFLLCVVGGLGSMHMSREEHRVLVKYIEGRTLAKEADMSILVRRGLLNKEQEAFLEQMDATFQDYSDKRKLATPEQKRKLDIIIQNVLDETQRIIDSEPESIFTIKVQMTIDLMQVWMNYEIQCGL